MSYAWGSEADQLVGQSFVGHSESSLKELRQHVVNLLFELTGESCAYTGCDMKSSHKGLGVTEADWKIADDLFVAALNKHKVGTLGTIGVHADHQRHEGPDRRNA